MSEPLQPTMGPKGVGFESVLKKSDDKRQGAPRARTSGMLSASPQH